MNRRTKTQRNRRTKTERVLVLLRAGQASRLDEWRVSQGRDLTRPEAIGRLLDQSLPKPPLRVKKRKAARKAAQLAEKEIEKITNASLPEQTRRAVKRRLIKGPPEFRNIRDD